MPFTDPGATSDAIRSHLWLSRRPRALPHPKIYAITGIMDIGFNITFYEIIHPWNPKNIKSAPHEQQETDAYDRPWVSGELYGDSERRHLRYSACTVSNFAVC